MTKSRFKIALEDADDSSADAYDYDLPEELIAAEPAARRERSRMMLVDPAARQVAHATFEDLPAHLRPGDRLVFNDTRVLPGRVMARKPTGGRVELLVLDLASRERGWADEADEHRLVCMTRSSKPLRPGVTLTPEADDGVALELESCTPGRAVVRCEWRGSAQALLEHLGQMPLPPYIVRRRKELGRELLTEDDTSRYQTVFASKPGAVAAPTAGLHFSRALLTRLEERGVTFSHVTLHVGAGTFKPMGEGRLADHDMHEEYYEVRPGLREELAQTRTQGGRVIAVGTTSARVLETEARKGAPFAPGAYTTELFLYPGHGFVYCDGLITNFHLPRSTLLTLVASRTGYAFMRDVYDAAIGERYRFYSYGDGMLILDEVTR